MNEFWRSQQPVIPKLGTSWDVGQEIGISGRLLEEWSIRYYQETPPIRSFPPPITRLGGREVWLVDQVLQWHTWMIDNDPDFASYRLHRGPHLLSAWGENKTYAEWIADPRCPLVYVSTLTGRLGRGWVPERAISTPVHNSRSMGSDSDSSRKP